tara:strand:- start:138 stop:575 length:438 start_codon:yes stop_codon:yes gene_type:complete
MNTQQDETHLELLETFHYVVSGMTVLFGCIPFIHLSIGIFLLSVSDHPEDSGADTPEIIGLLFVTISSVVILAFWILAFLIFLGGRSLRRRDRYMFCLVVAGVSCMLMPFGTALGVFTILVLLRPSVKQIFGVDELTVDQVAGDG